MSNDVSQMSPSPNLVIITAQPLNAEMPGDAWHASITPTEQFYVRNHFDVPEIDPATWRLRIDGAVQHGRDIALADLRALPGRTITATMACAGNNRLGLAPLTSGEPWGSGAVSTATWRGVSLREILPASLLEPTALELLFTGADQGVPVGEREEVAYARSLPIEKALDPDTLLVYEMNGELLPAVHGGPVRLIVPDWYGMASVKWLTQVTAVEQPFDGYYQRQRYVIELPGETEVTPLRTMRVVSRIVSPCDGARIPAGTHTVRGLAWSGDGAIARVEVRTGYNCQWQPAQLVGEARPHTWQAWEWTWEAARVGRHVLQARATDVRGNTQPEVARWNRFGYENNAIQAVVVAVHAGHPGDADGGG